MVWSQIFIRTTRASIMAVALITIGGAATARADSFDSCRRNVGKWEDRLDRDTHRYGFGSRQARHDRHELDEARESCERHFGQNWRDPDRDRR